MRKALIYKEWKKTKWLNIAILSIGSLLLGYIFMKLGRSFRFAGMEHLWDVIINRDQFLLRDLKYFPVAAGIFLGLAQFVPETIKKRIKLSLHLPLPERETIFIMLGYGQVVLLGFFILHIMAVLLFAGIHFPYEFIISMLGTLAPWYLAGLTAHSFVAMICLEPTWKRRVFNILLMVGTLKLFFISDFPSAYILVLYLLIMIPIYVLPFLFLSVFRFKEGQQD
ncbi:MAG: hypothetical protein ACEPOZ_09240 [Marinifilaceae bacterium]